MSVKVNFPWYHYVFVWAYTVLLLVFLPIIVFFMRKKIINKGDLIELKGRKVSERFGILPEHVSNTDVLFHCASVGEVNVATPLIKSLIEQEPALKITISTTSLTGASLAKKLFKESVQHCFLPFDIPLFVSLFLRRLSPKLIVITEVEFWPNLIEKAYRKKIALSLINGRISSKSLPTYLKLSGLYKHTLRKFDVICAQSQASYDNFLRVGVYQARLQLTNNIKFDLTRSPSDDEKSKTLKKRLRKGVGKILVGASTHDPEEQLLLAAYAKLRRDQDELRLLLVPRYPHRFDEVYALCKATGFKVNRLSAEDTHQHADADIWMIDTMGWLKACYAVCDYAFIGGSFAPKGGHNALEGALYARPMVMGPSIFNNPEISNQLESVDALTICNNHNEMTRAFQKLMADDDMAKRNGASGADLLADNAGAVKQTLLKINTLL